MPATEDCWRLFRTDDDARCWYQMEAHTTAMRFIGVVGSYIIPSIRNGERVLTEITDGPFYAFEMPWGRGPCLRYPEALEHDILHLETHELHLLCELEDDDTVVMTENRANVHEPGWTLRLAGDDSEDDDA